MQQVAIDYDKVLNEVFEQVTDLTGIGQVADYIPELKVIDPKKFGIHLATVDGQHFGVGDSEQRFSLQSIAKVFSLILAIKFEGGDLWRRVGVEPSGTPFNSLVQLELEKGIPRNPFINSGAIVICDVLCDHFENPKEDLLVAIGELCGNANISYNEKVAQSEKLSSYTNTAHINLMKAHGNINHDIDKVLDVYFHLCSIEMSCRELAQAFLFLACKGVDPVTNRKVLTVGKSQRINALMQTCGFYDEAGEFTFKVGLPGKSGVGGGIIALCPGKYAIAVWSPKLNAKGNSFKGLKALELFTTKSATSIF